MLYFNQSHFMHSQIEMDKYFQQRTSHDSQILNLFFIPHKASNGVRTTTKAVSDFFLSFHYVFFLRLRAGYNSAS